MQMNIGVIIVFFLGLLLITLLLEKKYYYLSKVFRVLKVLSAISLLLPILIVVWLFYVSSDPTMSQPEYIPEIFFGMLLLSTSCIGSLVVAWLIAYAFWLYGRQTNFFEISSRQLALILIAAVVSWFATVYLLPLILLGRRF